MIKKRTRPSTSVRARTTDNQPESGKEDKEDGESPNISDLLEIRKLRQARQGIDSAKLGKGDTKRKRRIAEDEEEKPVAGLRRMDEEDVDEDTRARRAVRTSNFTQQTNALDVDKHMMEYIEKNLTVRGKPRDESESKPAPADPEDALYQLTDRWKLDKQKPTDDGSVTNSLGMLTAIPEVDLGMDTRLKNIEDTERAKRAVADRPDARRTPNDEEHLVATRFYRPNLKTKSDSDILRDAKLEAMGLAVPLEHPRRTSDSTQMATDEMVMERFKKRMKK